jgi:hypothetical protein
MKINKLIITILVFICSLNTKAQQAWTQKKGEGYFQIGSSYLNYSDLHLGNVSFSKLPRPVTEIIVSSYNEFGITDKFTGILSVPFHFVSVGDFDTSSLSYLNFDKGSLSALGNVSTGLLYNLYAKNGNVLSTKLNASYNTSSRQQNTGLSTGYNAFILEGSILAGRGTQNYFTSGEISTVISANNFLSRIQVNGQIGKRFLKSKKLILIFAISTNTYLSDISKSNSLLAIQANDYTGLYNAKQAYYAINMKAGFEFSKVWSMWGSIAGGEATNIGAGINYALSIGYKLKKTAP